MGGHLTRKILVENVQELVGALYPSNTHLRMGQIMWPAVDENEKAAYGKSIEKTKLKPVFVDMIAPEDIEAVLQGATAKDIHQSANGPVVQACQAARRRLDRCRRRLHDAPAPQHHLQLCQTVGEGPSGDRLSTGDHP